MCSVSSAMQGSGLGRACAGRPLRCSHTATEGAVVALTARLRPSNGLKERLWSSFRQK